MKIYFIDFWPGFNLEDNFITKRLKKNRCTFSIDPQPEYLFCSSFGKNHFKFSNCIKIYYTGENDVPDFNIYDYAIAFQHISYEDRYLRFPIYLLYNNLYSKIETKEFNKENLLKRKFCNFVYSNSKLADPIREKFFIELSKYKKVDSGGRYLNNVGGPISNKLEFIKDYKFTIAFENSALAGYTTEKILEPMTMNSVPIYWGNPEIHLDFNPKSFIVLTSEQKMKETIERIIYLDTHDDEYINLFSQPWITNHLSFRDWWNKFDIFLLNILNQDLTSAKRTTSYGFVKKITQQKKYEKYFSIPSLLKKLKH